MNLPGFLLDGGVFFISAVPAVGSKTCLEQNLELMGFIFIAERCTKKHLTLMGFIFVAERCTRRHLTLMVCTGKGTQAWHGEHQSSDKGAVAHL